MKFDTLEKEFEYYHDLLEWKSIFTAIKGYTPLDHKDMSTIIDSIIIGVTTGLSTVEASSKFENTRKLLNNEKFKDFLFKITEKAQQSGKLVTRNLRSFNSLRMALVFAEVYRILEEKGISEPEAIAEKILISSIQSISENEDIESSENIRVKWASLLANTSLGTVKNKSFLKILDELEHKDAVVLDYIYHNSDGKVHTHHGMQKGVKFSRMSKSLDFAEEEIEISIDILRSKELCDYNINKYDISTNSLTLAENEKTIHTTNFGKIFLKAVS